MEMASSPFKTRGAVRLRRTALLSFCALLAASAARLGAQSAADTGQVVPSKTIADSMHAPTLTALFLPPLPLPPRVHGLQIIAEFDVDTSGKVLSFKFTPTPDAQYNRRLEKAMKAIRFRPGTTMGGVPIRATARLTFIL